MRQGCSSLTTSGIWLHSMLVVDRSAQVRLQRVIADAQHAARSRACCRDAARARAGRSAAPTSRSVSSRLQRGRERRQVIAADERRQIVQLDDIGDRQRHDAFDEPLELAHVARPVVGDAARRALPVKSEPGA